METVEQTPPRAALTAATANLRQAARLLTTWHAGTDPAGRVRAGHSAVTAIDDTLRALYDTRASLVDEIRQDETDRAARVEAMLAAWHQEREHTTAAVPTQVDGQEETR